MEQRLAELEQKIKEISERNSRVEGDKAWETSFTRTFSLAAITYVVALTLLYRMDAPHIFMSALVPVAGFVLSVQTLPMLKRWWMRRKVSQQLARADIREV